MEYTYTSNLENEIWIMAEELDENDDCESVIDFLNSKGSFQPFGARLAAFISQKLSLPSTDRKTIIAALSEQCKKNGVPLSEIASDGTLRNWLEKDKRPKKGIASRHSMFALAFALNLFVDETKDLFHKIYLDRAFNYRDEKEVIYFFCQKNNKSWTDAARLIANVDGLSKDYSDHTQYTQAISSSVDSFQAEQDLLDYICQNGHNFEKNSVTASKMFNFYLSKSKCFAEEEIQEIRNNEDTFNDDGKKIYSYKGKWIDNMSNNTLYEIITGLNITGKKGTKTVFNNSTLPKEIKNRFPEAKTFGEKDLTSEEYRKAIILLFSYSFWYQIQREEIDGGIDDYTDDLNAILDDCNYSNLYYGNPFDWMFLFCAQSKQPLELFRELLAEVLE